MATEERVRLFVCHRCESVDVIPWCGEDPNCEHVMCNDALEYRVAPHRDPADPRRYHGPVNLADIEKRLWARYSTRQDVLLKIRQITDPGAGSGLGDALYDVRSNYEQDAMACWKAHNRTTDCGEWRHSAKRLVPDTKAERRELGLETRSKHRPSMTYLCDFCPMRSIKETKIEAEKFGFTNPY